MELLRDYTPEIIEFTAKAKGMPKSLGTFEDADKARLFMANNLLAVQTRLTAERLLDQVEKEAIRDSYTDELENVLPGLKEELSEMGRALADAKELEKNAREMVNACLTKIQQLAAEVKEGIAEIELDQAQTWEVAFEGKKYYYAFINNEIKLAKVSSIPSFEMDDLISSSERNANFFKNNLTAVNG